MTPRPELAFLNDIPTAVIKIRKDLGMSQVDFAKACGVTHSFISHLETGRRMPSMQMLQKILKYAKNKPGKTRRRS